ncbi:hypothetical protein C2E23DRAFT_800212 [Lenzites betulinus]|nr:hypothetical protein C2E23DRAFT_800212 [Lenzites betulinus]
MFRRMLAMTLRAPTRLASRTASARLMSSGHPLVRPAPPPLPRDQQREFEELVRSAHAPLSVPQRADRSEKEADITMHPDARPPVAPEFGGEINPVTGEQGGPKREPVRRWGEGDGDWSFKGRVSDF